MTSTTKSIGMETASDRSNIASYRAAKVVPRSTQWFLFTLVLVLLDAIMMGLSFRIAYWIRFEINLSLFNLTVVPSYAFYQMLTLAMIPVMITVFGIKGLYHRDNLLGGTREYSELFNANLICMGLLIVVGFIDTDFNFARGWLLIAWLLIFFLTTLGRFILRRVVYTLRKSGYFVSPALIVGANDEGKILAEQLQQWVTSGLQVVGFVDKKIKPGNQVWGGLSVLGDMEHIDEVISEYEIEDLILATSAISSRDKMVDIFKRYGADRNIRVRFSSGLYEIITTGLTVTQFAYVPLVEVNSVRLTGIDRFLKGLLDYSLTIPGLIVLMPVFLVLGILVKLDSPGPIFHKRRVVGVNGQPFDAFKFRTMYINGDEILNSKPELAAELARNHKLKEDPRVTKIGHFLRKFSLDELPQLFNVIRREMSLVGPRMITEKEIEKYDRWDMNLLTVQPGITGLWQVSGRSDISYDDRVRLDMYYIRNWNIWLDLQLLIQTIPAVIRGRGAY